MDDPDGSIIESVAFSPNGKWLATGDATGNTYLWNLTTNKNKPAETLANPTKGTAALRPAGNAVYFRGLQPRGTAARSPPPTRTVKVGPGDGALTLGRGMPPVCVLTVRAHAGHTHTHGRARHARVVCEL